MDLEDMPKLVVVLRCADVFCWRQSLDSFHTEKFVNSITKSLSDQIKSLDH